MYQKLVREFSIDPRDVRTVPVQSDRMGIWFHVFSENGAVYVRSAVHQTPSSRIQGKRVLREAECAPMLALYHRRQRGERVSREASETTNNQVYWYGIFAALGL